MRRVAAVYRLFANLAAFPILPVPLENYCEPGIGGPCLENRYVIRAENVFNAFQIMLRSRAHEDPFEFQALAKRHETHVMVNDNSAVTQREQQTHLLFISSVRKFRSTETLQLRGRHCGFEIGRNRAKLNAARRVFHVQKGMAGSLESVPINRELEAEAGMVLGVVCPHEGTSPARREADQAMGTFLSVLPVSDACSKTAVFVVASTPLHVEAGELERIVAPGKAGDLDATVGEVLQHVVGWRVVVNRCWHLRRP